MTGAARAASRAHRVWLPIGVERDGARVLRKWTACWSPDRETAWRFRDVLQAEYGELVSWWARYLADNPRPTSAITRESPASDDEARREMIRGRRFLVHKDRDAYRVELEAWAATAEVAAAAARADMLDVALHLDVLAASPPRVEYHVEVVVDDPTERCTCARNLQDRIARGLADERDPACAYHGEGA